MMIAKPELFTPPNRLHIDKIWLYVSKDEAGNEGVAAATMPPFGLVPLIAADQARLKSITPIAEQLAQLTGMTITLVEFATRTELREIKGRADG